MKKIFLNLFFWLILAVFLIPTNIFAFGQTVSASGGRVIKEVNLFNFLSYSINSLINHGASVNLLILLLMLPVIATIIAFFRQVVGIKGFGIYTSLIITLSLLTLGLKYGLIILFTILIIGIIAKIFISKMKILYLPSIAIILTIITVAIICLLGFGIFYNKNLITSIFPIIIMITLVEKFVTAQISKNFYSAIKMTMETVLLSVVCYYIASWEYLRIFVLKYPEIIILLIFINLFIGRWTGLRILEYWRFWRVIKSKKS